MTVSNEKGNKGEDAMTRKKRKPASFDAMVKFFIRTYDIPTRKDINILMKRLDRIENMIKKEGLRRTTRQSAKSNSSKTRRVNKVVTATDTVFKINKQSRNGIGFGDIRAKRGFDEKKVRNAIYRLHNLGRISRKSRGIYIAST